MLKHRPLAASVEPQASRAPLSPRDCTAEARASVRGIGCQIVNPQCTADAVLAANAFRSMQIVTTASVADSINVGRGTVRGASDRGRWCAAVVLRLCGRSLGALASSERLALRIVRRALGREICGGRTS